MGLEEFFIGIVKGKAEALVEYGAIKITLFESILNIIISVIILIAVSFYSKKKIKNELNKFCLNGDIGTDYADNLGKKLIDDINSKFFDCITSALYAYVIFDFIINYLYKCTLDDVDFYISIGIWVIRYLIIFVCIIRNSPRKKVQDYLSPYFKNKQSDDENYEDIDNEDVVDYRAANMFLDVPLDEIVEEVGPTLLPEKKILFNTDFPDLSKIKLDINESKNYFEDIISLKNKLLPVFKKLQSITKDEKDLTEINNIIKWLSDSTNFASKSYEDSEKSFNDMISNLDKCFEIAFQWAIFYKEGDNFVCKYVDEFPEEEYDTWRSNRSRLKFTGPQVQCYSYNKLYYPYELMNYFLRDENFNFERLNSFFVNCQKRYNEIISTFLKTRYSIIAGTRGEEILSKEFEIYEDDEVKFFANVRFEDSISVENDGLIVTSNGIYSIESKHYGGKITITKDGKWVREKHGEREILSVNTQSNNHIIISERIINKKLKEMGIKEKIHIIPLIVMTNDNVDIYNESNVIVIRPSMIHNIIRENKEKNYTKKMRNVIIKIIDDNKLELLAYDEIDLGASLDNFIEFILNQQNNVDIVQNELYQALENEELNNMVQKSLEEIEKTW